MSFLPFFPPLLIAAVAAAALVIIWWVSPEDDPSVGRSRAPYWRRSAIVLLVAMSMLRPGTDGADAPVATSNVNVYFVVDTTSSMLAEDYNNNKPRMSGVRSDIGKIVQSMPGARFSIITFDKASRVRAPLTSDTTAIQASVESMRTEPPLFSKGSTITAAKDRLQAYLTTSQKKYSERGRIVIYMGDGEQTAESPPASMKMPEGLVDQSVVLGYGTSSGGAMKIGMDPGDERIKVDSQGYLLGSNGTPATSTADENNLKRIADDLGGTYIHRDSINEGAGNIVGSFDLDKFAAGEETKKQRVASRNDWYWVPLALAGLIGAWELGVALSGLRSARRREEGRRS